MSKRKIIVLVILVMLISAIPVYADSYVRIAGDDRYETSYELARYTASNYGKVTNVIVAYGGNYPDALSAGSLAKTKNAPVILVDPGHEAKTLNVIKEVAYGGASVYILGGTSVVSSNFESLAKLTGYNVTRLAGTTRYDTNLEVLKEATKLSSGYRLIVATGTGYKDALSASSSGYPMMLVSKTLTTEQQNFIRSKGFSDFLIVGGTSAVSSSVESILSYYGTVTRVGGEDAYETSYLIATYLTMGRGTTSMVVASGNAFPDGLSASLLAIKNDAPILLGTTKRWQDAHNYAYRMGISKTYIVGGTSVMTNSVAGKVANRSLGVQTLPKSTPYMDKPIWPFRTLSENNVVAYGDSGCLSFLDSNVPLYKWQGGSMQGIVDAKNSAAIYTYNPGKEVSYVFDHSDEGLFGLWNVKYGDTATIRTSDGKVRTFVCVGSYKAENSGSALTTSYGLDLWRKPYYDLVLCTCATANAKYDYVKCFNEIKEKK